jgi:S-adenosylmethionine:tRNA ribosyltransferase-isomerase
LRSGFGVADQKIGAHTRLQIVDAIVSGTHEPGTSHYELLRAFAADEVLRAASAELELHGYLTHEFGDSVWLERGARPALPQPARREPAFESGTIPAP